MAGFRPRAVFFDIDDTLYHKAVQAVPESALRALAALQAQGVLTGIATGRSPGAFPAAVREAMARFGMDAVVSINGQHATFGDTVLAAEAMDVADLARVVDFCVRQDWAYMQALTDEMVVSRDDAVVHGALASIGAYRVDPDAWRERPVFQLNVYVDEAGERVLHESGLLDGRFQTIRWHPHGVDYLPIEASKARGIAKVCAHLGIAMDEVMVFGDGLNDVEMFRAAGFAVAMGNARPELKAVADFVSRDVGDDGVWYALQALGVL